MASTVIRVAAVLLVATLATPSMPAAAQGARATGGNKPDTQDFQVFRQSLALRHNARVCEQVVPGYGETFGDLYTKWSETRRAEIARGESLFREALKKKDPKGELSIDRPTLEKVKEALAELAKPPRTAGPTPPAAQTAAACERLLTFLKED